MRRLPRLLQRLVVLLLLFASAPGAAQELGLDALGAAHELLGSAEERAALVSIDEGKYVRAREQAEAILAENPDSFIGTYVLAEAMYRGEANMARALFKLRKARELLLDRYGARPEDPHARRWHRKTFELEVWILNDMERFEESLSVIDAHDALYEPPRDLDRPWPLVKLRRFEEGYAITERYLESDDDWDRSRAHNLMLNLAWEERDRDKLAYWVDKAIERTQGRSCVILMNAAESALATLKADQVEELTNRARKALQKDCPADPREHLVRLYLTQGEFQKAISTAKSVSEETASALEAASSGMRELGLVADVLYLLGHADDAAERAERVVQAPDRLGMESSQREQRDLVDALRYQATMRQQQEAALERAATRPFWDSLEVYWENGRDTRYDAWAQRRRVIRLATHDDLAVRAVRPYFVMAPWQASELIEVFGTGVVLKAVAIARELDGRFEGDYSGYYDALEGEARWRLGEHTRAAELGERALEHLPRNENLLRWRTHAWLADLAWQAGDKERATRHYHEMLDRFPTALRILRTQLPVQIEHAGSSRASELAALLANSPRLTVVGASAPFTVDITGDETLTVCLRNAAGQRYACTTEGENESGATAAPTEELDADQTLAAMADRFHSVVLAPRVDLTQKDINSLEGSPSRVSAERALEGLLGGGSRK